MTALPQKQFTGEFPRLPAYDLPVGAAQSAINCDFTQGNLQGIKSRTPVAGISASGAKSIFIYDSLYYSYYTWSRDVDAVRSPIADDAYSRFYWCDGTNFYVSRGDVGGSGGEPSTTNRYLVGVPQPASAMTFNAAGTNFTINGYRPTVHTIFCEGSDGARKNETAVGANTFVTDTLNACQITTNVSASCDALNANVDVPTTSITGYDESGNPITETTTTSQAPSVTYKMAVEVRFLTETGYLSAVIRQDTNTNTYPAEMAGLTGSFAYSGNTLTVNLRTRSDYREARAYTYTYVNQYGEEGPPANPLQIDIIEGQSVALAYTPPGTHSYCPITRIRVYRTATGGTGTDYLFVGEAVINQGAPSFVDAIKGSALGETIQTRDFYPPPQNLRGIVGMPGGVLAGFSGNTVYLSQPYLPYAWKPTTTQALENRVIGLCPYENGLYVTTTAHPVLITGYSPETMSSQKIPAIQAGVSKGSFCNAGPFAVYASNDGLVTMRGVNASLDLSFKFFTREQWRSLYGSKLNHMRLNAHDGHLLGWFDDGTPGFLIKMDESSPSFTKLTDVVYSALVHPLTDALYVGDGTSVFAFKTSSGRQAWTHWSKDFILLKPENLGAVQLIGGGSVVLTVYADGTQVFQATLSLNETGSIIQRLPSGFMARRWSFKLEGSSNAFVNELVPVTSPAELKGV